MGVSPNCENNEKQGKSCIVPVIYVFGPSVDPIACIGFDYIGDTYLDMDTVEIDTVNYRYTYGNTTFITDVQKDKLTISPNGDEKQKRLHFALRQKMTWMH